MQSSRASAYPRKPGVSASSVLRAILIVVPVLFVVLYLVLALLRMRYPFGLEWMEGSMVDHVIWILEGNRLYLAPSLEFIPAIYNPLYLYLAAAFSKVIGGGFLPLRLISILSSIGTFIVLYRFVRRETGDWAAALVAVGFFAATYRISGAWFDIARPDSLFLFLLISALYVVRFKPSAPYYLLAGILIYLSFMTKQTAVVAFFPMMLYAVWANVRLGMILAVAVVVPMVASILYLDWVYDGWYLYYVFDLPSGHPRSWGMLVRFWTHYVIIKVPFAGLAGLVYLYFGWRQGARQTFWFYLAASAGFIGSSWLTTLHKASYQNVLFSAYAIVAILLGLGFAAALRLAAGRSRLAGTLVLVMCLCQFGLVSYNPLKQVPTEQDRRAGGELLQLVSGTEGDVFVPHHGYVTSRTGKGIHAHWMALYDILRSSGDMAEVMKAELQQAVRQRRYQLMIGDDDGWLEDEVEMLDSHYVDIGPVFDSPDVFYPVTGMRARPEHIWIPR
jgi:4-amino-4-deoxy-L-arabinose transferase-like glycosyltransferase